MDDLAYDRSFRTPVDRAFFESFLLSSRWNVGRLYALNLFESQKFRKNVKHFGQERRAVLSRIEHEMEKVRKDLADLEVAKEQVLYLPTVEESKALNNTSIKADIYPDICRPSALTPPPIFKTKITNFQKINGKKKLDKRKPLYLSSTKTKRNVQQVNKIEREKLLSPMNEVGRKLPTRISNKPASHSKPTEIITKKHPTSGLLIDSYKVKLSSSVNNLTGEIEYPMLRSYVSPLQKGRTNLFTLPKTQNTMQLKKYQEESNKKDNAHVRFSASPTHGSTAKHPHNDNREIVTTTSGEVGKSQQTKENVHLEKNDIPRDTQARETKGIDRNEKPDVHVLNRLHLRWKSIERMNEQDKRMETTSKGDSSISKQINHLKQVEQHENILYKQEENSVNIKTPKEEESTSKVTVPTRWRRSYAVDEKKKQKQAIAKTDEDLGKMDGDKAMNQNLFLPNKMPRTSYGNDTLAAVQDECIKGMVPNFSNHHENGMNGVEVLPHGLKKISEWNDNPPNAQKRLLRSRSIQVGVEEEKNLRKVNNRTRRSISVYAIEDKTQLKKITATRKLSLKEYREFYEEHDFLPTTAKYVPKDTIGHIAAIAYAI